MSCRYCPLGSLADANEVVQDGRRWILRHPNSGFHDDWKDWPYRPGRRRAVEDRPHDEAGSEAGQAAHPELEGHWPLLGAVRSRSTDSGA